ncbi:DUF4393 domain-containing protein [Entomomonas moraniae]|nr:DUF4393 domain-containing protein [Entomomonas moraniae]
MSEDKKPETVESAVIEYMDEESKETVGKELGKTAVTLTKTINTILLPIQATVYGVEKIKLFLSNYLENKLKNIPIENITPPKGNIAGPAIENLKYLDDSKEDNLLKEMYANLIANAMNQETKESTHPAFVEIIKQMDSKDILILEAIKKEKVLAFLQIEQLKKPKHLGKHEGSVVKIKYLCAQNVLSIANSLALLTSNLENLERLKLIDIDISRYITDDAFYQLIRNEKTYNDCVSGYGELLDESKGMITITNLGHYFLKACLD